MMEQLKSKNFVQPTTNLTMKMTIKYISLSISYQKQIKTRAEKLIFLSLLLPFMTDENYLLRIISKKPLTTLIQTERAIWKSKSFISCLMDVKNSKYRKFSCKSIRMATIEFQKKSFCNIYSKETFFIVRKNKNDKKPKLTLFHRF